MFFQRLDSPGSLAPSGWFLSLLRGSRSRRPNRRRAAAPVPSAAEVLEERALLSCVALCGDLSLLELGDVSQTETAAGQGDLGPPDEANYAAFAKDLAAQLTSTASDTPVHAIGILAGEGLDGEMGLQTQQSGPLIHLETFQADTRFAGIDGSGFSVVVLDTGLNLSHPFFGPDTDGDGVADRIVAYRVFTGESANAPDGHGHGSNVTSIIASQDTAHPGIAPGVNIIHLKVLNNSGSGTFAAVEQALQWVVAHAATYNIVAVNMSLGDGGNYNTAGSRYGIGDELAALAALDIITVSAAGNGFYARDGVPGVSYPSADPNSLSVGAVFDADIGSVLYVSGAAAYSTDADRITPFSQRHETLIDVFAPGAAITGAGHIGSRTLTMHGTSQAAPHVTGAAVLAQQLAVQELGRRLTPGEFQALLQTTGVLIFDGDDEDDNVTNTGLNFARLDMLALGEAIFVMAHGPAPLLEFQDHTIPHNFGTLEIVLPETAPNGDPLSYTAQLLAADSLEQFAWQLNQELGLRFTGDYYLNWGGQGEKWMQGNGNAWYFITPAGNLHQWTGSRPGANMVANSPLIATLDPSFHADPARLHDPLAPAGSTENGTVSVAQNVLTVTPAAGFLGELRVRVTASDSVRDVTETFSVNVTNAPPVLDIGDRTLSAQSELEIVLPEFDPDGDLVTYAAELLAVDPLAQLAWELDQSLGLHFTDDYFTGWAGAGEKWMQGSGDLWYFITPEGHLHRWTGARPGAHFLVKSPLVATLDAGFHADPSKLHEAPEPTAGNTDDAQVSIAGNVLTVTPAEGFVGELRVRVEASDGLAATVETFTVIVTDTAPLPAADSSTPHLPLQHLEVPGDAVPPRHATGMDSHEWSRREPPDATGFNNQRIQRSAAADPIAIGETFRVARSEPVGVPSFRGDDRTDDENDRWKPMEFSDKEFDALFASLAHDDHWLLLGSAGWPWPGVDGQHA